MDEEKKALEGFKSTQELLNKIIAEDSKSALLKQPYQSVNFDLKVGDKSVCKSKCMLITRVENESLFSKIF